MIIYEGFIATNSTVKSQLNFKRVAHDAVIRDRKKRKSQGARKTDFNTQFSDLNLPDQEFHTVRTKYTQTLRAFNNIAGLPGFFISGLHPYMVFICPRSGVTPHPLWIDGAIHSFVPLKNASITMSGFIYLNKNFDIRICTLPIEEGNLCHSIFIKTRDFNLKFDHNFSQKANFKSIMIRRGCCAKSNFVKLSISCATTRKAKPMQR